MGGLKHGHDYSEIEVKPRFPQVSTQSEGQSGTNHIKACRRCCLAPFLIHRSDDGGRFSPSFEKLYCCASFYLMQKWQKEGGRRKASISDTTEGNMGGGWGGGLVVSGLWPFCAI